MQEERIATSPIITIFISTIIIIGVIIYGLYSLLKFII